MTRPGVPIHVTRLGPRHPALSGEVPLVNGRRYTPGLGIDETGRVFIDSDLAAAGDGDLALKIAPTGRVYAETSPEPAALVVGLDEDARPFYEQD